MKASGESSIQIPSHDVVLSILTEEESGNSTSESASREDFGIKATNRMFSNSGTEFPYQENFSTKTENPAEVSRINPASIPHRPPLIPNELTKRRAAVARSYSRSKSRFFEPPYFGDEPLVDRSFHVVGSKTRHARSPKVLPKVSMATRKAINGKKEDFEDIYKSNHLQENQLCCKKLRIVALMELFLFFSLMGLLLTSLIDYGLQSTSIWDFELWKWCVLSLVVFSGRLVAEWFINTLVYVVERRILFKKKVLYFVHGVKKSVQVFLWLSSVLIAWILLVIHDHRSNNRSRKVATVLHHITLAIAGCLVGAGIWLVKTLLIMILAMSFHVKQFFDRIQGSLFKHYVLQILSGPPSSEMENGGAEPRNSSQLSFERVTKDKRVKEEVINVDKLQNINPRKVCPWTMKRLIKVVRRTNLSTISEHQDLGEDYEMDEVDKEIKSEWEAKVAAVKIFHNVARPGHEYIEEEDILRFMKMEDVEQVFPLFDGAIETGKIKIPAFRKWVVNAYLERKSLAISLNDTKTAVHELNNLASGIVIIVIIIVWNLMMGFFTTKILLFITSQLLLIGFIFGNTLKNVFEAIIFVFMVHPFDVGDRCVIDGVQMVVEEMNILTTIFLKYDNEKITYPNSVLATKPISNFYRSPEMSDSVEFAIDFSTKVEVIAALKDRIKLYIESKPLHWRPCHSVQLKEIVDMNKIKMALNITHTINFQDIAEKENRISDLVFEMKKIFEELAIRYHLIPQNIHLMYDGALASASSVQG